ncbi:putative NAD(P)H dehydrogenase (quinone) FQR1-like 2 isoform X1 [Cucumis melo var. makuwa]|uniref:NAD(P)H dehydrogenase (quinone) n=2 Tax=Cucumis melo TaxID=3656 RepID=A0A5A7TRD8_CUCMM|nr:probable NAD(P)H dehydrogenase (quinone) FQR1-like 2 isoform X1 [Cucumis melo]KAA0045962.1 putative NAD(P)H dehydrogenase (quinone) FQR1-like 2 isoform X1 [Cucumis melo var. makuwa]
MGKGNGCVPSKNGPLVTVSDTNPIPIPIPIPDQLKSKAGEISRNLRIFIVYYSMYGHVDLLAKRMKKGVDSVDGVEGVLFKVPETLPLETLEQMRVPVKDDGVPVISVEEMVEADGFLFGFPTRYGSMAAQMKSFFDSTIVLCQDQRLAGIPAGFFVSTGTQGGGQETTALTAVSVLAYHGMVYVPIGYTFGSEMSNLESIRGGSPYGAGVFSGNGSRPLSSIELDLAHHQGKYMATLLKQRSLPR